MSEVIPPKFVSMRDWTKLSGVGVTTSYQAISRGDLRARKLGAKLLIDVESGLAWLDSLPVAKIRMGANTRKAA